MESVILVIHLLLALAIIGLVLLQRSEGGGLGIGGGSGGIGNLTTAQGAASLLTRLTAIFATGFFITSLTLGVLATRNSQETGLLEAVSQAVQEKTVEGDELTPPSMPEVDKPEAQVPTPEVQPAPEGPITTE